MFTDEERKLAVPCRCVSSNLYISLKSSAPSLGSAQQIKSPLTLWPTYMFESANINCSHMDQELH